MCSSSRLGNNITMEKCRTTRRLTKEAMREMLSSKGSFYGVITDLLGKRTILYLSI